MTLRYRRDISYSLLLSSFYCPHVVPLIQVCSVGSGIQQISTMVSLEDFRALLCHNSSLVRVAACNCLSEYLGLLSLSPKQFWVLWLLLISIDYSLPSGIRGTNMNGTGYLFQTSINAYGELRSLLVQVQNNFASQEPEMLKLAYVHCMGLLMKLISHFHENTANSCGLDLPWNRFLCESILVTIAATTSDKEEGPPSPPSSFQFLAQVLPSPPPRSPSLPYRCDTSNAQASEHAFLRRGDPCHEKCQTYNSILIISALRQVIASEPPWLLAVLQLKDHQLISRLVHKLSAAAGDTSLISAGCSFFK